jgi:Family of unknown function (DUF6188)
MYGLDKSIDLSFLQGRELIQVRVGTYQTAFAFDEDVTISVEGEFIYCDGQQEFTWRPQPGAAEVAARTVSLLGDTIKTYDPHEDGTLKLFFASGRRLTVLDSSKEFESYDITRPGETIVV